MPGHAVVGDQHFSYFVVWALYNQTTGKVTILYSKKALAQPADLCHQYSNTKHPAKAGQHKNHGGRCQGKFYPVSNLWFYRIMVENKNQLRGNYAGKSGD